MNCYTFNYRGNTRELKKIIVTLLKSGVASEVYKMNYIQGFKLTDKNVSKKEIKCIGIVADDEVKLLNFLSKNFPQLERVVLK